MNRSHHLLTFFLSSVFFISSSVTAQNINAKGTLVSFCRTPAAVMAGSGPKFLSETTIFSCDNGQRGTLNELLGKGWHLHSLLPSLAEDPRTASIFTLAVLTKPN